MSSPSKLIRSRTATTITSCFCSNEANYSASDTTFNQGQGVDFLSYAVKKIAEKFPLLSESEIYKRLRYSTFVNFDRRYLYFEVPKAACTAMKVLLHKAEGLPPIVPFVGPLNEVSRELFIHDRDQFALPSLVDFNDEKQSEILESNTFFRFTVVRNPYARLQSAWRDKVLMCQPLVRDLYLKLKGSLPIEHKAQSFISFAEFIDHIATESTAAWDAHWRIQADHLFLEGLNFSHIGKIEDMGQTVELLFEKAGFARESGSGLRNESWDIKQYNEKLASRVWALYEEDFSVFGYTRESWRHFAPTETAQHDRSLSAFDKSVFDLAERNIVIGFLYAQRADLEAKINALHADKSELQEKIDSLHAHRSELEEKLRLAQCAGDDLRHQQQNCMSQLEGLKENKFVKIALALSKSLGIKN